MAGPEFFFGGGEGANYCIGQHAQPSSDYDLSMRKMLYEYVVRNLGGGGFNFLFQLSCFDTLPYTWLMV